MTVDDNEIMEAEKLLLPKGCTFSEEARIILRCWESKEILACPGSGKTTLLLAKLKVLSNKMPLQNGQGICVLSHTNIAVDEIKNKLSKESETILGYPNFVGTIQRFIDRYIVLPYLRTITAASIQFMDNKGFAEAVYEKSNKKQYTSFKYFVDNQCASYPQFNNSPTLFIENMDVRTNGLYLKNTKRRLAGNETTSAQQYSKIVLELLEKDGILRYQDSYEYFKKALSIFGSTFKHLFSYRFMYVFIDEYQDCSAVQREAIDILFSETVTMVQKIGDVDQAIYNGENVDDSAWTITPEFLPMCGANRYGQEIANVLINLRTNREPIKSSVGNRGIPPVLIIFDDSTKSLVLETYIQEIISNGLVKPDGVYKAVGMFQNVAGLKISDYWSEYQHRSDKSSAMNFCDYVTTVCEELRDGNLFGAEKIVRQLICRVYRYYGILDTRNEEGRPCYFNLHSIKKELSSTEHISYGNIILQMASISSYSFEVIESTLKSLLVDLVNDPDLARLPESFTVAQNKGFTKRHSCNIYRANSNICIQFDNVFGVKGETHDATLYLETETHKSTDLSRVMILLEGKQMKNKTEIAERSRKCIYVGLSRPKYLLCVAMRQSTYEGHNKAFMNWKEINLTEPR